MRVVRFLDVLLFLPPSSCFFLLFLLLAKHHLPARQYRETCRTSSAATQVCTCQVLIAVGLAGLLQCDSFCGPCQTFTARKSLWASPDFLRQIECQIECQKECQIECQKKCQKECQIECRNTCQMECQIKSQRENARWNARKNAR